MSEAELEGLKKDIRLQKLMIEELTNTINSLTKVVNTPDELRDIIRDLESRIIEYEIATSQEDYNEERGT